MVSVEFEGQFSRIFLLPVVGHGGQGCRVSRQSPKILKLIRKLFDNNYYSRVQEKTRFLKEVHFNLSDG